MFLFCVQRVSVKIKVLIVCLFLLFYAEGAKASGVFNLPPYTGGPVYPPDPIPITPTPPSQGVTAPTNFKYVQDNDALKISWDWALEGEITVPSPIFPPQGSLYSYDMRSRGHFSFSIDVEVSELNNNSYRLISNSPHNYYTYSSFPFSTIKFRVRAKRVNNSTDQTTYSPYLYSPEIKRKVKLGSPYFKPNGGDLVKGSSFEISHSSGQVWFRLVEKEKSCYSSEPWLLYFDPIYINKSKKVCTYATKSGDLDSDIRSVIFNVIEPGKRIIYVHTDLLGSPVAETK